MFHSISMLWFLNILSSNCYPSIHDSIATSAQEIDSKELGCQNQEDKMDQGKQV